MSNRVKGEMTPEKSCQFFDFIWKYFKNDEEQKKSRSKVLLFNEIFRFKGFYCDVISAQLTRLGTKMYQNIQNIMPYNFLRKLSKQA